MKPLSQYAPDDIKAAVAERYSCVATSPDEKFNFPVGRKFAESVGYESTVLDGLPKGMWESFTGAGNPQAFVDAKAGESVLDLGCGAGLDLYLYSQKVGPKGKLYGLDLSQAMLDKASQNLSELGVTNVEWLNASADNIPLSDNSLDLVTANGIYNLSRIKTPSCGKWLACCDRAAARFSLKSSSKVSFPVKFGARSTTGSAASAVRWWSRIF